MSDNENDNEILNIESPTEEEIMIEVEKPKKTDRRRAADNPKRSKQLEQLRLAREKKKQLNLEKKNKKKMIEDRVTKEMANEVKKKTPVMLDPIPENPRKTEKIKDDEDEPYDQPSYGEESVVEIPEDVYPSRIPMPRKKPKKTSRSQPVPRPQPPRPQPPRPQQHYYDHHPYSQSYEQPRHNYLHEPPQQHQQHQYQPQYQPQHRPQYEPPPPNYDPRQQRLQQLSNSIFGNR
jgi:hypothetical protein